MKKNEKEYEIKKNEEYEEYEEYEIKENFCGACVGGAIALVSGGGAIANSSGRKKGSVKKERKIALISSILGLFIGIIMILYYKYYKKCKECE